MSLNDIEAKADELAQALDGAGAALAKDLTTKLEGLAYAATIKRVADDRAIHNVLIGLRDREVVAMEQAAEANTKIAAQQAKTALTNGLAGLCRCSWTSRQAMDESNTVLGPHHEGACPLWRLNAAVEPTKPAVDRLHELLSYFVGQANDCANEAARRRDVVGEEGRKQPGDYMSVVYNEAADKLRDILDEGML
jgi:hypothetical protein